MKTKLFLLLTILIMAALLTGCSGNGLFLAANDTDVVLEEANYRIVATNVSGYSSAGYIVGFSYSHGAITESLALWRVSGTGKHYQEAFEDLWLNFESEYGSAEGRPLGLINIRYDADVINTVLYTESRIYVTADVIEYL